VSSETLLTDYVPQANTFDELVNPGVQARDPALDAIAEALRGVSCADFARLQAIAERSLFNQGVTFSVYSDQRGSERIFPFCLLPRVLSAGDWQPLETGLQQRVRALSAFLDDVYGDQKILHAGVVPGDLVLGAKGYLPILKGVRPPGGVRLHVAGIDLIRDSDGTFRVLEDNVRTPSGVSYVLENRTIVKRLMSPLLQMAQVHSVDAYPARLADALRSTGPNGRAETMVVLTPGPYNSAYFEHSFLARTMGIPLVHAEDLFVEQDKVWLRTTRGPVRVDVIYRRTDETFLDPEVFRPDSMLGVKGLMRAYFAGNVSLANAPGNGVADDKAVYAFVHEMIRFYLHEEPLLAQVKTWVCERDDDKRYVLEHLHQMVVKAVDEAGGYGMLMGPSASREEIADFAERIKKEPRKYIAQHRIELSSCPTWIAAKGTVEPRRVDLRPYVLSGANSIWVLPSGLTRVALKEGSYVVNSSQGGGSKDTWVLKSNGRSSNNSRLISSEFPAPNGSQSQTMESRS
jgi:uncharacterized circularly permuted ATP-grasp superfamily protein